MIVPRSKLNNLLCLTVRLWPVRENLLGEWIRTVIGEGRGEDVGDRSNETSHWLTRKKSRNLIEFRCFDRYCDVQRWAWKYYFKLLIFYDSLIWIMMNWAMLVPENSHGNSNGQWYNEENLIDWRSIDECQGSIDKKQGYQTLELQHSNPSRLLSNKTGLN